jgi:hypothetical protein
VSFYHFHIPKTGGSYIENNLILSGIENIGIKKYSIDYRYLFDKPNPDMVLNSDFIHGHFGIEPLLINPDIKSFTTLRNPVTRVVSHFAMLYFPIRQKDSLRVFDEWLFDDSKNYTLKNNLQARFLTNKSLDDIKMDGREIKESEDPLEMKFFWGTGFGIDIKEPTYNDAKNTLDSMVLVGKMEEMDIFMGNLYKLINDRFNINLIYSKHPNKGDKKQTSQLSKYIQNNITDNQIQKILILNDIDIRLWNSI